MFAIKRSKSYLNFYKFLQFIVTPILKIIYRVEIINKKNSYVNTENGLILCSNHLSALDPIMMCAYFPKPIYFLAKIEIFRNKFVKSIVSYFNAFPINREGFGLSVVKKAIEILKAGNVIGIFPEGTRSLSGEIGEIKKGIGLIAYLSNSPILTMALFNSKKIPDDDKKNIKNKKKSLIPKIKIIYGEVINTKEIIKNYPQKEAIDKIADIVLENIKNLYSQLL